MKLEDRIRRITPYTPGEQPGERDIIKLNTNECPYPPSPAVTTAMSFIKPSDLRLYPDPEAGELVKALSEAYGVPCGNIFVGVGSDDVLALSFLTFFSEDGPGELLFPDVTYSFYPVWAELYRIPYRAVPTDGDFKLRVGDYTGGDARGVIFPNPNAPTGICEPVSFVDEIAGANPNAVVIADEAYIDFGGESALPLIDKHENLLVVQTASKSRALAGLRVGWAFGSRKLIDALKAVKFSFNSYTMSRAAIILGSAAIRDGEYLRSNCEKIVAVRESLAERLRGLGFTFPESKANFIFAKHERLKGADIFKGLKERRILVRRWELPRIEDYLRITVGTEAEAETLVKALKEITEGSDA